MSRFNRLQTKSGIAKAFPLEILEDPCKGYISHLGGCVFGVEIFVIEYRGKVESVSMLTGREITNRIFTWVIKGFSKLGNESHESEVFASDKTNKWCVICLVFPWFFYFFLCIIISVVVPGFCRVFTILPTVVPEGSMRVIRSMVLELSPVTFGEIHGSVYAEYKLRVLDQINGKHFERTGMSTLFFFFFFCCNCYQI